MRYLGPSQIQMQFEKLELDDQLETYKKAFYIKSEYPEFTRTDCIAVALGHKKCISGSEFYEDKNSEL